MAFKAFDCSSVGTNASVGAIDERSLSSSLGLTDVFPFFRLEGIAAFIASPHEHK